jgi:hypothetical protein
MNNPKIVIKKSKHGRGVFAARDIKKGEKILTATGERITSGEFNKVAEGGRNVLADPLQIGDDLYIILEEPALMVNHSCDPNSGYKNVTLYAIKNIKKGEEITFDYSTVWFEAMRCNCGKPNCRGYISDFVYIPEATKRKYKRLGIVPKWILKKYKK